MLSARGGLDAQPGWLSPWIARSLAALDLDLSLEAYCERRRHLCWARCLGALAAARLREQRAADLAREASTAWCLGPRLRRAIAHALAAREPKVAAAVAGRGPKVLGLLAYAAWRAGDRATARELLAGGTWDKEPDLHLLAANLASPEEGRRAVSALETYFRHFGLTCRAELEPGATPLLARLRLAVAAPVAQGSTKVSLLMAARNAEAYVESALTSVLTQSWRDLEVIVVDDASTDRTAGIVGAIVSRDRRVQLLRHAQAQGPSAARNTALASATGDFVMCHDADDVLHPDAVRRQVDELTRCSELVGVSHSWVRISDDGLFGGPHGYPFLRWSSNGLMFRRRPVLESVGWYSSELTGGDTEYHRRVEAAFGQRRVARLGLPLKVGAFHAGSLTAAPETGVGEQDSRGRRTEFLEATSAWHIAQLRAGRLPFVGRDGVIPYERGACLVGGEHVASPGDLD